MLFLFASDIKSVAYKMNKVWLLMMNYCSEIKSNEEEGELMNKR